jgi:hypothetical protein
VDSSPPCPAGSPLPYRYRILRSKRYGGYFVIVCDPSGRPVQTAGWWSGAELLSAHRWGRAAVADYSRIRP